jgi:proteasome activator subunit 4
VMELIPSEAQFVGSTARLALRSSKYQPLEPEHIGPMLSCLVESMHGELWTERAAALQFLQYFWFRNAINMGEEGSEKVLDEAMRLLEDEKLEVREMACDTVSGVIRALSSPRQEALRTSIVAKAKEIFPDRKRRRANGAGDGKKAKAADVSQPLAVRHGAVLALRALVMSSPYDVPQWLPEILMALVRVASEPAPVKKAVTEALADFRRTHEEGGLQEMKDVMTPEQWEAVRDVAVGAASYFV